MSNGGDAAEQVIKISLDGVDYAIRIAGAGAKNLIALLMALAKSKKSQPPQLKPSGKERLKRMIKSGSPLDVFPVREQDIRTFTQEAKKYGIVYCAVRDKQPKPDGMVDVLVRKEDSPKINRVMERLQYAAVDKTSIKSEIVKTKSEKGTEPAAPDKSDNLDVDSFLDSVLPDEGKSKEGQNQAVKPPVQQASPEVNHKPFFMTARTKQNPSGHGLESSSTPEKKSFEPPSVKEEIQKIRSELNEQAKSRVEEPQRGKSGKQQTTRHKQPNTRKSKNKTTKER
ncbi:MAG: PcfB family protein [Oscillospiraceae bacterium]|nr:PcfB family protein [Oscillospiraceae bacterium]